MTSADTNPPPLPTAAQRCAIEAPLGPVLVVAGPGAGKTFCLIERIRHLIQEQDVPPARICAVTFTNKAADEIAQRLRGAIGAGADEITRGTLHALCHSVLRAHPVAAGLAQGFGIADMDCQGRVLRRLKVPKKRHTALLALFGRHRLQGYELTPGDRQLHDQYRAALRSRHLVDFDDLVGLAGEVLHQSPEAAAATRGRWDYVLVDEFQDLSLAQYRVITSIVNAHRNCFAVGDDEQSIFSWTGADPHILERFRSDFEIATPVVLNHNRRCSIPIFDVARRLIGCNPSLFDKRIEADRPSVHEVTAVVFDDEALEASWVIADLRRDRSASDLEWGDYALLYRQHALGQYLEAQLLQADIPCRLATGQALLDDEVISYVIASLRLIHSPDDSLAMEALAEHLVPSRVLDQVRSTDVAPDLMANLRRFARGLAKDDPDRAPAWRFIYHVGNLAATQRAHRSLGTLVDELLTQRMAPYRNPLEERAAELTDPAEFPEAPELAKRLAAALDGGRRVRLVRDRGVEIAIARMLAAAGFGDILPLAPGEVSLPGECVLGPTDARPGHWPLLVFKAIQLVSTRDQRRRFLDYVAFDLETTSRDPGECEIVEIAAVRVRNGVIVEQFERLVRPTRPIPPAATKIHGYCDADVWEQPYFAEIWPAFLDFVQSDVLVAHNGLKFDVPVLRRMAAKASGIDRLVFFDTLPLARSLCSGSARLEDLARRYGVHVGRAHHALDDVSMLAGVVHYLGELSLIRARTSAMVGALGYLGLAFALNGCREMTVEEQVLRDLAVPATLGRFSNCLDVYADECAAAGAPPVDEIIERLGGVALLERLRAERSPAERYPAAVARLHALVDSIQATTLADAIDLMLARVALSTSGDAELARCRVNLLTLHATKGLEFSRVYIVGAEDRLLPGLRELETDDIKAVQEGRRLLYVGMTRAKERLVLTRTLRRNGWSSGGDRFLRDAGLAATTPGDLPGDSTPAADEAELV
jgi:DNA helicase-2/ATP-dependent DNA helicase PcrA